MGRIGDPRAVAPLITALKDKIEDIRQTAAEGLSKIGAPAVEPLLAALKDKHPDVKKRAAEALGQIGDARAIEPLIAALGDNDWSIRRAVAEALGQTGASAVEPLIAVLKHENEYVRWGAASALGLIGDERAVEPLSGALKDNFSLLYDSDGEGGDVEPLIGTLDDKYPFVRQAGVEALGRIGDERAIAPLISALKDDHMDVRRVVAEALGRIGPSAVEPLIAVLKHENQHVRRGAAQALGRTGDARAVAPLLALVKRLAMQPKDGIHGMGAVAGISALEQLLDRAAANLPANSLQNLARLQDVVEITTWMDCYTERSGTRSVDCATIRQRARQELIRRGLSA